MPPLPISPLFEAWIELIKNHAKDLVVPFARTALIFAALALVDFALPELEGAILLPWYALETALWTAAMALLAVDCNRVVLAREDRSEPFALPEWTPREWKIALLIVASWLVPVALVAAVILVFGGGFASLFQWLNGDSSPSDWDAAVHWIVIVVGFVFAIFLAAGYVCARLWIAIPDWSLDGSMSLGEAWQRTEGNGWRLFFLVMMIPTLLAGVIEGVAGPLSFGLLNPAIDAAAFAAEYLMLIACYRALGEPPSAPQPPY